MAAMNARIAGVAANNRPVSMGGYRWRGEPWPWERDDWEPPPPPPPEPPMVRITKAAEFEFMCGAPTTYRDKRLCSRGVPNPGDRCCWHSKT